MTEKTTSTNPLDIFIVGVRKGINIALLNLTPNVLMAFVFAHMLTLLGVMDFLGQHCGPFMALFGLPGQAITVLLAAWLSASAGAGMAASLLAQGVLDADGVTVILPAIFLMASQIQYMGRLLGVADCPKRYWPLLMLNSIVNALLYMWIMRLLMPFFS